jgi:hypothetical protein
VTGVFVVIGGWASIEYTTKRVVAAARGGWLPPLSGASAAVGR